MQKENRGRRNSLDRYHMLGIISVPSLFLWLSSLTEKGQQLGRNSRPSIGRRALSYHEHFCHLFFSTWFIYSRIAYGSVPACATTWYTHSHAPRIIFERARPQIDQNRTDKLVNWIENLFASIHWYLWWAPFDGTSHLRRENPKKLTRTKTKDKWLFRISRFISLNLVASWPHRMAHVLRWLAHTLACGTVSPSVKRVWVVRGAKLIDIQTLASSSSPLRPSNRMQTARGAHGPQSPSLWCRTITWPSDVSLRRDAVRSRRTISLQYFGKCVSISFQNTQNRRFNWL